MPQPNRGGHATPNVAKPITTTKVEQTGGSAKGTTMFSQNPKGTRGSKNR